MLPIHIDYVKLLLALYQTVSELEYITKFYNVLDVLVHLVISMVWLSFGL